MIEKDAQVLEWCKRLISTPSVTTDGTRGVAELCARELLAPAGIEARLAPSRHEGDSQVNLIAFVRGRDRSAPPIVFNTHLDTVPPGDAALWTQCGGLPFAPAVVGDRIYGLGSADTKLDFVAKTIALLRCGRPRRDLYLIGTFGEEHGLLGAKEVAAMEILPRGALAFVGEPSHLAVVTAHKGLMAFALSLAASDGTAGKADRVGKASRIIFTGRAAHSSTPHLGRNAIAAALDFIAARPQLDIIAIEGGDAVNKVPARCELTVVGAPPKLPEGVEIADAPESVLRALPTSLLRAAAKFADALGNFTNRSGDEADFAAPAMTSNVGVIHSAEGAVRLEFELRPPPGLPIESVRRGVESISSILGRRFKGIEVELRELRANPGFRSGGGTETVEIAMAAMAKAGLELETAVKAGCTEAGVYAAAGLKPVVFGPGPSVGVIHAPNEYNLLSEVEAAIRFYRALLEL